jgi:hypothetical protein
LNRTTKVEGNSEFDNFPALPVPGERNIGKQGVCVYKNDNFVRIVCLLRKRETSLVLFLM